MDYKLRIKKKIILIQLLLLCLILSTGVLLKVYAINLISTNMPDNITQTDYIRTNITYNGVKDSITTHIDTNISKDYIQYLSNIKCKYRNNSYIITGKLPLNIVYPEYDGKDKITVKYIFNSSKQFVSGEVENNTALKNYINDIVVKNISNANSSINKDSVVDNIDIESNNNSEYNNKDSNNKNNIAVNIAEESDILSTENFMDDSLLQINVKNTPYILGESTLDIKIKDLQGTINKDGIDYIYKVINGKPTIVGVVGTLKDISYNNITNTDDMISLLGSPLEINDILYWQYENTLFISYNNNKFEILLKI